MIDKLGSTIDFYLSSTRNTNAVRRDLAMVLRRRNSYEKLSVINVDQAFLYYTVKDVLGTPLPCSCITLLRTIHVVIRSSASSYVYFLNVMSVMFCVGMQFVTLCVTGRKASLHEFPRRPWELAIPRLQEIKMVRNGIFQ